MKETLVDIGATIAKIGIDKTELSEFEKFYSKVAVDLVAEKLKQTAVELKRDAMRFEMLVQKYEIDKIVAIPAKINYKELCFFRIYGKQIKEFAQEAGIALVDSKISEEDAVVLDESEKKFGKTVYEKQK